MIKFEWLRSYSTVNPAVARATDGIVFTDGIVTDGRTVMTITWTMMGGGCACRLQARGPRCQAPTDAHSQFCALCKNATPLNATPLKATHSVALPRRGRVPDFERHTIAAWLEHTSSPLEAEVKLAELLNDVVPVIQAGPSTLPRQTYDSRAVSEGTLSPEQDLQALLRAYIIGGESCEQK